MFYLGLIDKTASLASDPDLTSVEQSWKHIHWSCVLQWQRKNVYEGCPEHPLKAFHGYWRKITVNPLYQIILNHTIITEFSRPTSKGKSVWKGRMLCLPFASLKFEIQENYSMSEKHWTCRWYCPWNYLRIITHAAMNDCAEQNVTYFK